MIWNEENDHDRTAEQIKREWEPSPDQRTENKVALLMLLFIIVAIPFYYWWYLFFCKKLATSIAPEYIAWEKKYNERQDYLLKQFAKVENGAIQKIIQQKNLTFSEKTQRITEIRDIDLDPIINDVISKDIKAKEPKKYQYPPGWRVFLYSAAATLLSMIGIFWCINLIGYGIRRSHPPSYNKLRSIIEIIANYGSAKTLVKPEKSLFIKIVYLLLILGIPIGIIAFLTYLQG